ncbi:MAG: hypothetical protein ACI4NA_06800 [Succinivibrio sp.]
MDGSTLMDNEPYAQPAATPRGRWLIPRMAGAARRVRRITAPFINGCVPVRQRQAVACRFKSDPKCWIMVIPLKADGSDLEEKDEQED